MWRRLWPHIINLNAMLNLYFVFYLPFFVAFSLCRLWNGSCSTWWPVRLECESIRRCYQSECFYYLITHVQPVEFFFLSSSIISNTVHYMVMVQLTKPDAESTISNVYLMYFFSSFFLSSKLERKKQQLLLMMNR